MTATDLLRDLGERGVELWVEGERLRYRAPKDVLGPALLAELKERKAEILAILGGRSSAPLSYGQQALWFLHKLAPQSAAYNVAMTGRIRAAVDEAALAAALGDLVARHPSLRTTFKVLDGRPVQQVHSHIDLRLEKIDATGWDDATLRERVAALYREPFELERGPLTRAALFTRAPDDHVFLLTQHHIITDFWSLTVLAEEAGSLYAARCRGAAISLPPLSRTYLDHVERQARSLTGSAGDELWSYWRGRLAGELPVLDLPLDHPRPAIQSQRGASQSFWLSRDETRLVKTVARGEGATVYVTLLGVFLSLLHRYTGQDDLLVGSLTANRGDDEFAGLVGYFVNPIVIRAELAGDPSFTALLQQLRGTVLEALRHEAYPFALLVDRLTVRRHAGTSPIFQTLFALHSAPRLEEMMTLWAPGEDRPPISWGGLPIAPFDLPQQEGQFDLSLEMMEVDGRLAGTFKYNSEIFEAATIARMAAHFEELLRGLLADPGRRISQAPALPKAELGQVLVTWNDTRPLRLSGEPLHALVEASAVASPEAIAIVDGERRISYRALDERASLLARRLRVLGIGPECLVGLCVGRSLEMIVGILGILKAGAAYVPLDPAYPEERLRFMMEDAGIRVLVTLQSLAEKLGVPAERAVLLDAAPIDVEEPVASGRAATDGDLAYVLYTSGSTGRPKGVAISHRSAVALVRWAQRVFSPAELAGVLASTSISFDLSVFEIFVPLSCGGTVIVAETALHLPLLAAAGEVTLINTVPSAMKELLNAGALPRSVLTVNLAGEPFSRELVQRIYRSSAVRRVYNLYGPTEDTTYSTFTLLQDEPGRAPPIGRPIDDTCAYLLNRFWQPVPIGATGELYLGGAGLARGYLNRPELTAERFIPDPFSGRPGARLYRTGDYARYVDGGDLEFLGRRDHQVKVRGVRIETGEIERVLGQHPAVREAVVVAREAQQGKRLVAYVVASGAAEPAPAALQRFLLERLPEPMVPSSFVLMAKLPLNPNGKVDRRALPAPSHVVGGPGTTPGGAPSSAAEERLAAIWAEVLRIERVGVHDNFFELGGDSILGILAITRANQAGLRLSPQHISRFQTIAELAAVADAVAPVAAEPLATPGEVPLTPIQSWFFATEPAAADHFNQSVVLEVPGMLAHVGSPAATNHDAPRPLDPALLCAALRHLATHHDALRLRFTPHEDGLRQSTAAATAAINVRAVDLSALAEAERPRAWEAAATAAQQSLELRTGRLLAAVLFHLGRATPDRLLLIIHHLAVDAISWRLLIEDLSDACARLARGEAPRTPPQTTSFRAWSLQLAEHARSAALSAEQSFWLAALERPVPRLPVDTLAALSENTWGSSAVLTAFLDADETHALLREVPAALRTQINEVLLTALALAFHRALGVSPLLVDLEGHGREPLISGLDASRAVGWFTSVFPVLLPEGMRDEPEAPIAALKAVKELLRRIPNKGIGHGLLRYLQPDEAARQRLAALPAAEISFNYLGQLDQGSPRAAAFRVVRAPVGIERGAANQRRYLFDVVASVKGGRLEVEWMYGERVHARSTVERLAAAFVAAVRELVGLGRAGRISAGTPSDFPAARLNQGDVDTLLARCTDVEDIYALSPMQEGMLFHALYAPEVGTYLEQPVLRLRDELVAPLLERAFGEAAERHSVLRTSFHFSSLSRPVQVVHRRAAMAWTELDLRGLGEQEQEARTASILANERSALAALDRLPLLRCALLRIEDGLYDLVISHQHMLLDGWSLALLLKEVLETYGARRGGVEPSHGPAPRYRAYIAWLQQQDLPAAERYFRAALHGLSTPPAGAPAGRDGATVPAARGASHPVRISRARIEAAARRCRLTVNTLVQGAWALTLSRYGAGDDVVWGTTVSDRPVTLPGVERLIGLLINTIPVRARLSREVTVAAWLATLQDQFQQGAAHAYAPLAEIQRWSGIPAGAPLFESLIVFESYPVDRSLAAIEIRNPEALARTHYSLTLVVSMESSPPARLSYDTRRWSAAAVCGLATYFEAVLDSIIDDPEKELWRLPPLAEAERRLVLDAWNRTGTDYPRDASVHRLIEAQIARSPDAIAVAYGARQLRYRELGAQANRLARRLRSLGVGIETRVALCLDRSPEMVVAMLAVLKAGAAYVPLDPAYPAERIAFMLADSQSPVLLTDSRYAPKLSGTAVRIVCLDAAESNSTVADPDDLDNPDNHDLDVEASPESLAYVIYTSGSTGVPKGVMVTHRAIARLSLQTNYVQLGPEDRIAQASNASFDAATFEIWAALLCGARVVGVAQDVLLSPPELAVFLEEQQISVLFVTTALFNQIASHAPRAFRTLRYLLFGGEAVDPRWVREVLERGAPGELQHVYGPTESTTFSSWCRMLAVPPGASNLPIGRPISNTRLYVLDRDLQPVPIGAAGEICIGGDGLARGYLQRPGLTAGSFPPDPFSAEPGARLYRTGDLGRFLADGNIEFLGRLDDQVKIRGFRIELGEIEATLAQHPAVRAVCVALWQPHPGDKRLAVYAVPAPGASLDPAELGAFLRQRLPEHMIPAVFVELAALPLTPNGKLDRRSLPVPAALPRENLVPPRDAREAALARIWCEVLGLSRVGVHDDFFQLGGDSILSIQIVSRAAQAGLRLTVREIWKRRTIAQLADAAIPAAPLAAEEGALTEPVPLTPIQRWFFSLDLPDRHHFNQSCILESDTPLDAALLTAALQRLVDHHSALRLRFTSEAPEFQYPAPCGEAVPLWVVEASGDLAASAAEIQSGLDLSRGPLLRALLIRSAGPDRVLLVIHHLVVDAVSMRILIEDLATAYAQLARDLPVLLAPKTTSFLRWAQILSAQGPALAARSQVRTLASLPADAAAVPLDYPADPWRITTATQAIVSLCLNPEETRALLTQALRIHDCEVNDVLLCVLARAFFSWAGMRRLIVDVEGHGREEIFDGVDLSRTVGWFTSICPVLLDMGALDSPDEALAKTREARRRVPNHGLDYGVLRYLSPDPVVRAQLAAEPRAQVSFNYLGRQDRARAGSSLFRYVDRAPAAGATESAEPYGREHAATGQRPYPIGVLAWAYDDRLRVDWAYSSALHERSTIERLAEHFADAARELLGRLRAVATTGPQAAPNPGALPTMEHASPLDFPDADLNQNRLDRIIAELDESSTED